MKGVAVQNLEAITRLRNLPVISEGAADVMRDAEIEIKDVDFSYEEKSLFRNMNLSIPANRTTAIVGSSGSGKTTLCSLIARFWDVDRGEIRIGGVDVRDYRYDELLSNFTFVFQDVYLFDDRSFASLSGGEKQKVSFVRCLAQNAKLLLLDEPTAALDTESRAQRDRKSVV